jgi:hypothetical protein
VDRVPEAARMTRSKKEIDNLPIRMLFEVSGEKYVLTKITCRGFEKWNGFIISIPSSVGNLGSDCFCGC